ncbi:flagellar basal-body MS-ring/collar protein FliF [Meridianimarinicoccus sp. RP-17]|uniref:flagellar basal-body MS-ring/collar protein FliF n=1 Tax=Meridianimarinicoccus zhengii TaxID=2056810 RepID=UPI000DABDE7D|nr:flagellar basal-body MS-ring/collar protein FliF [Phycocomes zhengii]
MDSTAAPLPQTRSAGALARARRTLEQATGFTRQPAIRRAMPAILLLSAAVIGAAVYLMMAQPDRVTLATGLPEAEKANAMQLLTTAGIDVVLDEATGELRVAQADYHRARMQLAAEGLPQAVADGFSMISDMPMGTSRSVEGARLRRMQELDLAASIAELQPVSAARVHLALPERTAFIRDTEPPRASVIVQLAPGRSLDAGQVRAIVSLVSTSVPGMAQDAVSVVDQAGRLLSQDASDPLQERTGTQLAHQARLEAQYRARIEALITPLVGMGNAAVEVALDMDFTRSEIMNERYDPDGRALRSEQESIDQTRAQPAVGVPGAIANTPPPVAELEAEQAAEAEEAGEEGETTNRHSSFTRNYEVSRSVETIRPAAMAVSRVHAAVLLRSPPPGPDGAPTDMPAETVTAIENLVRTAVGFDAARGDVVTVSSGAFVDPFAGMDPKWYEAGWIPGAGRQLLQFAALAVIVLGVVRPLLNRVLLAAPDMTATDDATGAPGNADAVEVKEGESLTDLRRRLNQPGLQGRLSYDEKVTFLRGIAETESSRIATVFQSMIDTEKDMVP